MISESQKPSLPDRGCVQIDAGRPLHFFNFANNASSAQAPGGGLLLASVSYSLLCVSNTCGRHMHSIEHVRVLLLTRYFGVQYLGSRALERSLIRIQEPESKENRSWISYPGPRSSTRTHDMRREIRAWHTDPG